MNRTITKFNRIGYLYIPIFLMIAAVIPFPFLNKILHLYQPLLFALVIYLLVFDRYHLRTFSVNFFTLFILITTTLLSILLLHILHNSLFSINQFSEPAVIFQSLLLSLLGHIIVVQSRNNQNITTILRLYTSVYCFIIMVNLAFQLVQLFYNPTILIGISYTTHKILPAAYKRFPGLFPYPANSGLFIGIFLLQLIRYYSKKHSHHINKIKLLSILFLTILSGLLTVSKVFLFFLGVCLIYVIIYPMRQKKLIMPYLLMIIFLNVSTITILSYLNYPLWWGKYTTKKFWSRNFISILSGNRLKIIHSSNNTSNSVKTSGVLYEIYQKNIKHHWLLGIGPGKIKGYESDFLFVFALGGIFILIALYLMLMFFIYRFYKQNKKYLSMIFSLYTLGSFFIPVFFCNVIQVFVFESLIFYNILEDKNHYKLISKD